MSEESSALNARVQLSSARGVSLALRGAPWVRERPVLLWSAAEVSAWFRASDWPQYEQHFSRFDGSVLLALRSEEQLMEQGVLPRHAGRLLAALRLLT